MRGGVASRLQLDRLEPPRMSRWTLGFDDPHHERAYWLDFARRRTVLLRRLMMSLAILVGMFNIVDYVLYREHYALLTALRFGVTIPLIALAGIGLYWRRTRRVLQRNIQAMLVTLTVWTIATLGIMGWILAEGATTQSLFVSALTIYFGNFCVFGISGVRFTYGIGLAAAALVGWFIIILTRADPDPRALAVMGLFGVVTCSMALAIAYALELYGRRDYVRALEIEAERARAEALILNVLPRPIAEQLRYEPTTLAERHEEVAVLFADVAGFAEVDARLDANGSVKLLDRIFRAFDALVRERGLEKIKTIGHAYMAAAGVPDDHEAPVEALADLALAMQDAVAAIAEELEEPLSLQAGLHVGPVVAGVIGRKKFAYDLWGDTVNVASRLQSHGEPGRIQLSAEAQEAVAERYATTARGPVRIKGKGMLDTWWLEGAA